MQLELSADACIVAKRSKSDDVVDYDEDYIRKSLYYKSADGKNNPLVAWC